MAKHARAQALQKRVQAQGGSAIDFQRRLREQQARPQQPTIAPRGTPRRTVGSPRPSGPTIAPRGTPRRTVGGPRVPIDPRLGRLNRTRSEPPFIGGPYLPGPPRPPGGSPGLGTPVSGQPVQPRIAPPGIPRFPVGGQPVPGIPGGPGFQLPTQPQPVGPTIAPPGIPGFGVGQPPFRMSIPGGEGFGGSRGPQPFSGQPQPVGPTIAPPNTPSFGVGGPSEGIGPTQFSRPQVLEQLARAFTPKSFFGLLPSQNSLLDSIVSSLGAPPQDFRQSLTNSFPQGMNPTQLFRGSF